MLWGISLWFPAPHLHCPLPHIVHAGEVQAFYEDLSGRQYVNEVFNFSVDKLYDLLFTDSPFQRDFMEQRRFSGSFFHGLVPPIPSPSTTLLPSLSKCPSFPGPLMSREPPLWPSSVPDLPQGPACYSSSQPCSVTLPTGCQAFGAGPQGFTEIKASEGSLSIKSSSGHLLVGPCCMPSTCRSLLYSDLLCVCCDPHRTHKETATHTVITCPRSCS